MLILTAGNVTGEGQLEKDGRANYTVWVGINHHQIWAGPIEGHVRAEGAGALLRRIADALDAFTNGTGFSLAEKPSPIHEALSRVMKAPACPRRDSKRLRCEKGCTWPI